MKKSLPALLSAMLIAGLAGAQVEKNRQLPSVAIGAGVLSFKGDVGSGLGISSFSRIRAGYNLTIGQRFGKILGVNLTGLYGKLSDSDRGTTTKNFNFQTTVMQGDLNLVIHLDNDLIFKRGSDFAPYLFGGIGYLKFDPYGDLKDKNNKTYNYWSDGTIRDIAETDVNAASAVMIQRDYTFETQLKDSTTNYSRGTFVIPAGLGFKLKLSDNLDINLAGTYYFAMSDYIDNVKMGKNDNYFYANVSLQYNFGKPYDDSPSNYKSVNFSMIDKLDSDEDGVSDNNDRCPDSPKGVKVNNHGCPEDNDEDGVPDYRDKELMTKKDAIVDENGITQTDQMIAERQAVYDSLATERSQLFNENPSLAFLKDIEAKSKSNSASGNTKDIPYALKPADLDHNGFISADEITAAIDSFFEGDSDFTVERLNDLIDFFFEQ